MPVLNVPLVSRLGSIPDTIFGSEFGRRRRCDSGSARTFSPLVSGADLSEHESVGRGSAPVSVCVCVHTCALSLEVDRRG